MLGGAQSALNKKQERFEIFAFTPWNGNLGNLVCAVRHLSKVSITTNAAYDIFHPNISMHLHIIHPPYLNLEISFEN